MPHTAALATTHSAAHKRNVALRTRTSGAGHAFRLRPASARTVPAPEQQAATGRAESAPGQAAAKAGQADPKADQNDAKGDQAEVVTGQADAPADTAAEPAVEPTSRRKPVAQPVSLSRRSAALPPPLRGSLTSLERQNEKADAEGLERIEDEDDLSDRIAHKLLVPVPVSAALTINGNLPENHRYCRSWTARFLVDLARAHAAQFPGPLEVSSAVRTVEYQKRLMAVNGNAAKAEGDVVSPHLTGATIDIAKSGMTQREIGWMRSWLLPLQTAGKIDVEEEFQQACFHITVYKSYVPPRPASATSRTRGTHLGAAQPKRAQPRSPQPSPDAPGSGTAALGR